MKRDERVNDPKQHDAIMGPVSDQLDSILLPTASPRQGARAPADE